MSKELDARIALVENWTGIRPSTLWGDADLMGFSPSKRLSFVPRWSSDLNLMRELEERLTKEYQSKYYSLIFNGGLTEIRKIIHMSAEQKAEAWLKVMEGK